MPPLCHPPHTTQSARRVRCVKNLGKKPGSPSCRPADPWPHSEPCRKRVAQSLEHIGAHVDRHESREERTETARMNRDGTSRWIELYSVGMQNRWGLVQKKSCSLRDNVNMAASKASYMVLTQKWGLCRCGADFTALRANTGVAQFVKLIKTVCATRNLTR